MTAAASNNTRRVRRGIIKSPLNYTGGKTKLLPQLLPLFPPEVRTFTDLFCGGGNVGINVRAQRVLYNDSNAALIGLLNAFRTIPYDEWITRIHAVISAFGLSDSQKNGYAYYGCSSGDGLGPYNKERFIKLRTAFNSLERADDRYYIYLYVLIVYSFNNQIRFNKDGEFNLPVGKRDFNSHISKNFREFVCALQQQNTVFLTRDFRDFDAGGLGADDFIYCDPPYLITTASYNERNGWTERDERDLLRFLDGLDRQNVKFGLSNVLVHKGRENEILRAWAKNYRVHPLDFRYNNSSYHGRNTDRETAEVFITNY